MQLQAIIVAGGSGTRMQQTIPKQFLLLNGRPILMHTLECFYHYSESIELIVVLPLNEIVYWQELCKTYSFKVPHTIVGGGKERFYSVKNGIDKTSNDCLIAIHDGVRPLVSQATIERCYKAAEKSGASIPVMPVTESLREMDGINSKAVDRSKYRSVQTPQVFTSEVLRNAYQQPYSSNFTDDASVVESLGYSITLVDGNVENIKITTPQDLLLAELLLKK